MKMTPRDIIAEDLTGRSCGVGMELTKTWATMLANSAIHALERGGYVVGDAGGGAYPRSSLQRAGLSLHER